MLQRKLEEHEEALLGRAQVVDLLQQELTAAEQRNQVLPCVSTACLGSIHFHFSLPGSRYKILLEAFRELIAFIHSFSKFSVLR